MYNPGRDPRPCRGCGALAPDTDEPTHGYIGASGGCGTVLDVRGAGGPAEHAERVRDRVAPVWRAWSSRHETACRWARDQVRASGGGR